MDFIKESFEKLSKFGLKKDEQFLVVKVDKQKLYVCQDSTVIKQYDVSTGEKGIGNKMGSYKTPLGSHIIDAKYGDGEPIGTIFEGRKSMKQTTKIYYEPSDTPIDFVTTRILHLRGLEQGYNAGKGVDTYDRFIYIHGTQEEGLIGTPASKGCIRMRNKEVVELYDETKLNTYIEIVR